MEEIAAMKYLKDEELCFRKLSGGFLSLTIGEKTYPRVMVQRAFPLSEPTRYLSVREIREDREPEHRIRASQVRDHTRDRIRGITDSSITASRELSAQLCRACGKHLSAA